MCKAALASAALTASLIVPLAASGPASASPTGSPALVTASSRTPVITSVKVSNVLVTASNRPKAKITVKVSDPYNVMNNGEWTDVYWDVDAEPTAATDIGYAYFPGTFKRVKNTRDVDTWTARSSALDLSDDWGRYRAVVKLDIHDYDHDRTYTPAKKRADFYVRGNVRLTRNASPEPVRKGRTLKVTGRLKGFNGEEYRPRYLPAPSGVPIKVYFTPGKHGGTKKYVGKATTNAKGYYAKSFTAKRSGRWYAKYRGSDYYTVKMTGGDYVRVRG